LQDKFGKTFPISEEASFKKDHATFVFNRNIPSLCLDINSTTGYQNLDLSIKKAYEYVWNNYLTVSEQNMKYHFCLQNIIKPNEFYDLHAVREYLIQNIFNKEETTEKLETILNNFYNNIQLKFINIINETDGILNSKNNNNNKNNNENEELETNAEIKLQMAIDEHKHKTDIKIKMLEMENEKLKQNESENSKQIKTLLGELAFKKSKLDNAKDRVIFLTKEKNDLIFIIQKMEVKEDSYQTLQNKIAKEQKKNRNLRTILEKEYEKKDTYPFLIKENLSK